MTDTLDGVRDHGLGGPARYLTERTRQSALLTFESASALALPFDDGRFEPCCSSTWR